MSTTGIGVESQVDPAASNGSSVATLAESPPAAADPGAPVVAQPPRARRRRLPIILGVIGVLLVALVAGALKANATLSDTYSPQRAIGDYLAAQSHRDVDAMWANANFLRGEGAYSDFFGKPALAAMLQLPANSAISNVRVTGVHAIDGSTTAVSVSMTWNGNAYQRTFTLHKDQSRVHWFLYPSWKIDIPSTNVAVTLPAQPGSVSLDGIEPPAGASQTALQGILGYHEVQMGPTDLWQTVKQDVDASSGSGSAALSGTLSDVAQKGAGQAVRDTVNNCDAGKYDTCFNHTYNAPDSNFIYFIKWPGYGDVDYTKYVVRLTGDLTAGMKLTVLADPGKVSASGTCTSTVTVDGSRVMKFKGTWSGTLTSNGAGNFSSDITWDCTAAKA